MSGDRGDRPLIVWEEAGEEEGVNVRWKTTNKTGVVIQRKILDCSMIMGAFGYVVTVAYKNEAMPSLSSAFY